MFQPAEVARFFEVAHASAKLTEKIVTVIHGYLEETRGSRPPAGSDTDLSSGSPPRKKARRQGGLEAAQSCASHVWNSSSETEIDPQDSTCWLR